MYTCIHVYIYIDLYIQAFTYNELNMSCQYCTKSDRTILNSASVVTNPTSHRNFTNSITHLYMRTYLHMRTR